MDKLKNNCYEIDYGINIFIGIMGFQGNFKKIVTNKFFLNSNFVAKLKSNNKASIKILKNLDLIVLAKTKTILYSKNEPKKNF